MHPLDIIKDITRSEVKKIGFTGQTELTNMQIVIQAYGNKYNFFLDRVREVSSRALDKSARGEDVAKEKLHLKIIYKEIMQFFKDNAVKMSNKMDDNRNSLIDKYGAYSDLSKTGIEISNEFNHVTNLFKDLVDSFRTLGIYND